MLVKMTLLLDRLPSWFNRSFVNSYRWFVDSIPQHPSLSSRWNQVQPVSIKCLKWMMRIAASGKIFDFSFRKWRSSIFGRACSCRMVSPIRICSLRTTCTWTAKAMPSGPKRCPRISSQFSKQQLALNEINRMMLESMLAWSILLINCEKSLNE